MGLEGVSRHRRLGLACRHQCPGTHLLQRGQAQQAQSWAKTLFSALYEPRTHPDPGSVPVVALGPSPAPAVHLWCTGEQALVMSLQQSHAHRSGEIPRSSQPITGTPAVSISANSYLGQACLKGMAELPLKASSSSPLIKEKAFLRNFSSTKKPPPLIQPGAHIRPVQLNNEC